MFEKLKIGRPILVEGEYITPHTSRTNLFVIAVAGLGGFNFGYANNAIAGSFAQPSFLSYFLSDSNASSYVGGILGAFLGGGFLGAVAQAPISHRWGRRITTATGAGLIVVGGALQAGSIHIAMFIVARFICGIGAGIVITNCPVYMSEVSPPHTRGLLTGSHAITIIYAYILSSVLALGWSFIDAPYQWRLQFVVLTLVGILLLGSLKFIPESPRWLTEKERYEEAWAVLQQLHRSEKDPNAKLARAEMRQIQAQIEAEQTLPSTYLYIFRNPSTRKRAICSILVWVMGQSTGILVIANLTPTLFGGLGYGTTLQFGLSIVWVCCALIGGFINAYLMDIVGRVKLLGIGGYLCSATLICEAVLQKYYLGSSDTAGLNGAVAMFFVFIIFYGATIDCAAYCYIVEIWPTHLRSKGSTIGLGAFFLTSIAYNTPASLAFSSIGANYYFVFVSVCVISATIILFYCPETKGLTLEEIGEKFGDKVVIHLEETKVGYENGESGGEPSTTKKNTNGLEEVEKIV